MRYKLVLIIAAAVVLVGGGVTYLILRTNNNTNQPVETTTTKSDNKTSTDSAAVTAGKQLSNSKCSGVGSRELARLPMDQADYAMILPYGLMVGGHVTPIDHQYFSPTIFNSPRDTYPVYAMADSKIVDIQPRTTERGTEYRFVFTMSCTFLYYYDLVTSLAPDIQKAYEGNERGRIEIDVKAGDLVGKIGGQTLDFAVWDTEKPLSNFIVPEHYVGESWKMYTADPLNYYSAEAKANALAKYIRTNEPISGRIDYDIDGKLIGNWFETGTTGYAGATGNTGQFSYWVGHLAIAPEYIDNSATIISFGSWNGKDAKQFIAKDPIDPKTVGIDTGLVMYELYQGNYKKSDGSQWDSMTLTKDPKFVVNTNNLGGCVLMQLTETRKLKVEQFPLKKCSTALAFTSAAKQYER